MKAPTTLSVFVTSAAALVLLVAAVQPAHATTIYSALTSSPPTIDGTVSAGEWTPAGFVALPHGAAFVQHDASRLYVLLDMLGDATADPNDGDHFWASFDVNLDTAISPNVDKNFACPIGTSSPLMMQMYLAPNTWTTLSACASVQAEGFGQTVIAPFPNHRFWEVSFSRDEIAPAGSTLAAMGIKTFSTNPSYNDMTPAAFSSNFSDLVQVVMLPEPATAVLVLLGLLMAGRRRR